MKKLFTFGCSWTFGVGANYYPGVSRDTFMEYAWSAEAEQLAFRSLIAKQRNYINVNFSKGGSSNERNFRILREQFVRGCIPEESVVLFGITSTARHEFWSDEENKYISFKLDGIRADTQNHLESDMAEFYTKYVYNHEHEVDVLTEQMLLWNEIFDSKNIKVLWYDTFNTHSYPCKMPNLFQPDLLTTMLNHVGERFTDVPYHYNSWLDVDERIEAGINHGIIEPYSLHPSREGHQLIAEILGYYL